MPFLVHRERGRPLKRPSRANAHLQRLTNNPTYQHAIWSLANWSRVWCDERVGAYKMRARMSHGRAGDGRLTLEGYLIVVRGIAGTIRGARQGCVGPGSRTVDWESSGGAGRRSAPHGLRRPGLEVTGEAAGPNCPVRHVGHDQRRFGYRQGSGRPTSPQGQRPSRGLCRGEL